MRTGGCGVISTGRRSAARRSMSASASPACAWGGALRIASTCWLGRSITIVGRSRVLALKARNTSPSRSRSTGNGISCAAAALAGSGEPALAPAVMLDVAIALAAAGGEAEIELLDVLVGAQAGRRAVEHDAAVLEDVAVIGVAQRDVGVLLGEEEAHPGVAVQAADDLEDLLDDLRRQPHRGLVEQDQLGLRHQRAA